MKPSSALAFFAVMLCIGSVCGGLPQSLDPRISSSGSSVFANSRMGNSGGNITDPDEIIPWPADMVDMIMPPSIGVRGAWSKTTPLWPKGAFETYEVAYYIDKYKYTQHQINTIVLAVRILERSTNINFVRLCEKERFKRYHILFTDGSGCSAHVGYQKKVMGSSGHQKILLREPGGGYACRNLESVLHEILHALGMGHEHQRPDRDQYVTVVAKGGDYDIIPSYSTDTPYDLASLMQYRYNKATIYANDANLTVVQTSRGPTPSSCDYHWLNTQYPGKKPAPPCEPNVVMRQCEPLPEYKGIKTYEDYCLYNCGMYLRRPSEESTVYCKFITDEGSDLPIDAVTEYMKVLAKNPSSTTTTTTTTKAATTNTTTVSSRSHCCALPQYEYSPRMQEWCNWNNCHEKYCTVNKCKPLEIYKDMPNMQWWCDENDCPSKYCVSDCETAV